MLTFLYSTCGATCVVIAQQIRGALDELRATPVAASVVSVDPRDDTPARRGALPRADVAQRPRAASDRPPRRCAPLWQAYGVIPASAGASGVRRLRVGPPARPRTARAGAVRVEQLTPEALAHDIGLLDGAPTHPQTPPTPDTLAAQVGNLAMMFSTKAEYGVRVMVELARRAGDEPVPLAEIAEHDGLPLAYLEHLVARLRKAGLVDCRRGSRGGYMLARPAARSRWPRSSRRWRARSRRSSASPRRPTARIVCSRESTPSHVCPTKLLWTRVRFVDRAHAAGDDARRPARRLGESAAAHRAPRRRLPPLRAPHCDSNP